MYFYKYYIIQESDLMKKYVSPSIEAMVITKADILAASDVLINGGDLFGPGEEN